MSSYALLVSFEQTYDAFAEKADKFFWTETGGKDFPFAPNDWKTWRVESLYMFIIQSSYMFQPAGHIII